MLHEFMILLLDFWVRFGYFGVLPAGSRGHRWTRHMFALFFGGARARNWLFSAVFRPFSRFVQKTAKSELGLENMERRLDKSGCGKMCENHDVVVW